MKTIDSGTVIEGFGNALATVISAVLEKPAASRLVDTEPESGYVITIKPRRGGRGTLYVHFDRTQAEALVKRMAASDEEPSQAVVLASLKEICGQAATTLVDEHPIIGAQLDMASAEVWAPAAHWASATTVAITIEGGEPMLRIALAGTLELVVDAGESVEPARQSDGPNINVILDIDLPLVVRFGRTEMSLKDLAALGPGSLINLGRSPDDPVDVLVSNQIVARGEVVTVAGSYGVRIRDVISPVDRVRSVEVEL